MSLKSKNDIAQRRAINFDLSIEKLMAFYSESNPKGAYKEIYNYLTQNGFEHRQGSGYCSKLKLINRDVLDIIDDMFIKMPWLDSCSKKIDVTNIGAVYDIKKLRAMDMHQKHSQKNIKKSQAKSKSSIIKRLEENKKILSEQDGSKQTIIRHKENER